MADPWNDEVAQLRRVVLLMAETMRDALESLSRHRHEGEWSIPNGAVCSALDRALGRLDAVTSSLGVGERPAGGEGEGRDEG